jgi:hypothetical protein
MVSMNTPVLATCHIRPFNQALESTFPCLSQLADSPEEEENRNAFSCLSSQGVTDTVHGILAFIKRLTSMSFQSLRHRLIDLTKPTTTSLMEGDAD